MSMENYFQTLNSINVNGKTEQKNGLTYLSWAWAWGEVKKLFPDSTYTIYEAANGCFYHTDGKTCWVKTGVTVNGIEHIEYLPVMDFKNKSITAENVTSFDVNKAIQRSLTKAVARHGLGLYIYAGEDLPEAEASKPVLCQRCGQEITPVNLINGSTMEVKDVVALSNRRFGKTMCSECMKIEQKERENVKNA
jgi:hypothetical protein